jgi:hypothetical protein
VFDFDEEIVEFKLKGKSYKVRKPTNGEIKEYNKKIRSGEDGESTEDIFVEFLNGLGLEGDVYNKLNPSQAKKLVEALYGDEKN